GRERDRSTMPELRFQGVGDATIRVSGLLSQEHAHHDDLYLEVLIPDDDPLLVRFSRQPRLGGWVGGVGPRSGDEMEWSDWQARILPGDDENPSPIVVLDVPDGTVVYPRPYAQLQL